jgi:uncharacterized membrane protein
MALNHTQYAKQALKDGKPKEEIYRDLLDQGLKIEEIEDCLIGAISDEDAKEEAQKKTVRVVATIGAILIGLGIFSFIAANWQEMTREGKMMTVIFSMVCVDALGWVLREKSRLEKSGEAMLFLGSIIFGGAVFLAAQMYNTRVYWPDGFLWWGLGALFAAWALEIASIRWLAIFAGFVGLVWYPFGLFSRDIYHPLFLTPWLLLLVVAIAFLVFGFKLRREFLNESPKRY